VIPVLDSKGMRAADSAAIAGGIPSSRLMENAARGLAARLAAFYPNSGRVTVVCGPGNNGGDGLAAARLLAGRGLSVSVFTLGDPEKYRGDAAENAGRARAAGLELVSLASRRTRKPLPKALRDADVVVDALFGTGLTRALSGSAARAVAAINRAERPVVAADIPSGLSADTGETIGPAVRASLTTAFAALKHAHVFWPARGFCGRVTVEDIGIPRRILLARAKALFATEPADLRAWLPPRYGDTHKADFGRLAVVAGSRGKAGAAVLTARGALRAGAGLVTVFCPASIEPIIVSALPEAMTRALPEKDGALSADGSEELVSALSTFDAAAAGPGLGTAAGTVEVLQKLLAAELPIVFDADGLNAFAGRLRVFSRRKAATVLTPHPGEAGRLLRVQSSRVQRDRRDAARRLSRGSGAVVILKGAASLIADPSGGITVNPTGAPLMATAGSGDVLTGCVGAFLAQGLEADRSAIAAAYLHGLAGEVLSEDLGDAGLLSGELADALPLARRCMRRETGSNRRETGVRWRAKR
jgi:ADP-dependent NAD(P)H-hydrate dehydratase / NAD(P)H-hydrate epimerase